MTPRPRMLMRHRVPFRAAGPRTRSLRSKLTLVNVVLLALGITIATAVSLFGLRHYLLDSIDSELIRSRDGLQRSELTINQIESLSSLAAIVEKISPSRPGAESLAGARLRIRGGRPVGQGAGLRRCRPERAAA